MSAQTNARVRSYPFYAEYHGHRIDHLSALLPALRRSSDALIWTAGDSSLDNKYWFSDRRPAALAYRDVLDPPESVCDVTYWMNALIEERQQRQQQQGPEAPPRLAAINAAVEATTLNERTRRLRPQDRFLRDNLRPDDVLIVSVGGNDVALAPTPCTIASIGGLLALPTALLRGRSLTCCAPPCDDCCCGCGPSLLSCAGSCPPCLGYLKHLFGVRVQKYIERLTEKTLPSKVLVCMIYYPDEAAVPSWAGGTLGALGYNDNPARLQLIIRKVFEEAVCRIRIPGTKVVPVPLFRCLDGKSSEDYVARVEPSAAGGRKMAEFLLDFIQQPAGQGLPLPPHAVSAPSTSLIAGRR